VMIKRLGRGTKSDPGTWNKRVTKQLMVEAQASKKHEPANMLTVKGSASQSSPILYHTSVCSGGETEREGHNFALAVDSLVFSEGIRHANQISLVGEITTGGMTQTGLFTYVFGAGGICTHRSFSCIDLVELTRTYLAHGHYTLEDSPQLSIEEQREKEGRPLDDDGSCITETTNTVFTVLDKNNDAVIRICRLHAL